MYRIRLIIAIACLAVGCARAPTRAPAQAAPEPDASPSAAPQAQDDFPRRVTIKSRTRTFNSRSYYALKDGRIWTRANEETTGVEEPWHLMGETGLPAPEPKAKEQFQPPEKIVEISADADELAALASNGQFYFIRMANKSLMGNDSWNQGWGFPDGPLSFTEKALKNRSWTIGRRNSDVLYHNDIDGNPHHYGTMGITTMYVLGEDGHTIIFTDSGLPTDFSHRMCGPMRGRFIAESLANSASTMFVIDKFGDMYTRMADFDTVGSDPMFFTYSYKREFRPKDRGEDYWTNYHPWSLPSEPWKQQPAIELHGKARLTRDITILQNGRGNAARELRVAGLDVDGNPGYYTKGLNDDRWSFRPECPPGEDRKFACVESVARDATGNVDESHFLPSDPGTKVGTDWLGPVGDVAYSGELDAGRAGKLHAKLVDFNLDCTPAVLQLETESGKTFEILLHSVEAWTFLKRDDPGRDGTPKIYLSTLEIPEATLKDPDAGVQKLVKRLFSRHNLDTFSLITYATTDWVQIESNYFFRKLKLQLLRGGSGLHSIDEARLQEAETDGFTSLVNAPALDMANVRMSDPASVQAALAINLEVKSQFAQMVNDERKRVRGLTFKRDAFGALNVVLKVTQLRWLPKVRTISRVGDRLLHAYDESGRLLLFSSQKDYENAVRILDARIDSYRARLRELGAK